MAMLLKLFVFITVACVNYGAFADVKSASPDQAYPAPFSTSNRVLSMVVAYSLNRMDPLMHTFRGQQNMCEGGWDNTLVIFTTARVTHRMKKYIESKLYCHRTQVSKYLGKR